MSENNNDFLSIKNWAVEDRPREKLLSKGRNALSNAELLAILLGSGTGKLSALDLAKQILNSTQNNLNQLAKLGVGDLKKFKGIGEAKAINIVSALELGRRRKSEEFDKKIKITSSRDVYEYIKGDLMDLEVEQFWVIYLNRANIIQRKDILSSGGVSGTVVDTKIIFKKALEQLCSGLILVHNHPSGNKNPSQHDINITKKISRAGDYLEIKLLDHLIFAGEEYFSFADENMM
ncbi:MAG TPA: DNA repair protein RadC [Cyclobacteriaceae bacterium]